MKFETNLNSGSRFSKETFITFSTQVAVFVFGSIASIVTARILGPAGKGILTITLLIPYIAILVGSLGIGVANVYFIGKKKYSTSSIVGSSQFLMICIGLFLVLLLLPFIPSLTATFLKEAKTSLLYISILLIPLSLLLNNLSSILLGQRRITQLTSVRICQSISSMLFILLFLLWLKMNITGAILAAILSTLLALLLVTFWNRRNEFGILPSYNRQVIKDSVQFGLKGHLGTVFQYLNYRLDMFLVAYLLTKSDVGQYSIAVIVAELIWYVPDSISRILFPKTAASNTATANKFTPLVCRNSFLLTSIGALILFFISDSLIPLVFGPKFIPAIRPLKLLLPGIVALGIWKILCNDLAGRGFPQYKSYGAAISLAITVILDIILIPKFSISGAAIATSIAYIVATLAAVHWFIKISKVRGINLILPQMSDFRYYGNFVKSALFNVNTERQK